MLDILICSRCDSKQLRPKSLAQSTFSECPFVCVNCRCKDCSVVLEIECECGSRHAERSKDDMQLCANCYEIRKRVMLFERSDRRIREYEILKEEPLYGVILSDNIDSVFESELVRITTDGKNPSNSKGSI